MGARSPITFQTLRRDLRRSADPARAKTHAWFFKAHRGGYGEGDRFLGLRVPQLRRFAKRCTGLPISDIERLLRSVWHEERLLALIIIVAAHQKADPRGRNLLERIYLRNLAHVNQWDLVDVSAPQLLGSAAARDGAKRLFALARRPSLWERRMAIVATQYLIRQGDADATFRLSKVLLKDPEDLVHKAVGWMLREAGARDPRRLRRFLDDHSGRMPRTMLRYAMEKFRAAERQAYLRAARKSGT